MKRRTALMALACAWGAAAAPPGPRSAVPAALGVLAWGATGCWVDSGGASLHRLPDALAPGIDPVATALGVWLVDAAGVLRCWEPEAARSWRLRCTLAFAAPVHALAASPDGRWALVAHGEQLSLIDGRGEVARTFDGTDLKRERRGAAAALFALPQRRSFFAAWPALGESWEISVDPDAAPIFDGLVHDYRMSEGIARPGYLGARRAPLGRPLPAFGFADPRVPWLAGTVGGDVVVVHLDVRRRIAALPVPDADPRGAALRPITRGRAAHEWWLPAGDEIHVFDTARWVRAGGHTLPGPVRRLHASDDSLWALVGAPSDASLFVLRDGAGDAWQPVRGAGGALLTLCGQTAGTALLVLRADPPALLRIGAGGEVLPSWPLPPARWAGAAWRPAA